MTSKKQATTARPARVGFISLGCAKNLVDAELMIGALIQGGVEITNDAADADVVIVNTCAFIDSAQEESVDAILQSAELREARNRGQGLVVSGCLPQRFREDLPKLLPEVDVFMGIDQVAQAPQIVQQALEHRARRLAAPKPKAERSGTEIVRRIAKLEEARGTSAQEEAEHVHGIGKGGKIKLGDEPSPPPGIRAVGEFGKTKTMLSPAAALSAPVVNVTQRPVYIPDYAAPRFRLTPRHFAYVKIAEGCNHPCSFCTIPRMRGSHRSRTQADIVQEARLLIADGVRELNLISQDSTYYGLDLRANHSRNIASPAKFTSASRSLPAAATTLRSLLRELNDLPGDFWIRLLYTHPAHWTDELIQTIAECPKVARYVDMPLQHIHHNMLERMRRETSRRHIVDLIAKIRAGIPGIAIRTTFIVGFPGETEEYFESLLEFIRATKFERLGVFTYSREDGTPAGKMQGQIPGAVKKRRRNEAMAAQLKVAREISASMVGRELKVLVEAEADGKALQKAEVSSWEHGLIRRKDKHAEQLAGRYLVARSEGDAPDIDGRVYTRGKLALGEFAKVKIIGHTDYDLIAEAVNGKAGGSNAD